MFIKMKAKYILLVLLVVAILVPQDTMGQCAMCRAVLESDTDTSAAEGINNGIVYLMAIPYLLVGGLFYIIYRKMKS